MVEMNRWVDEQLASGCIRPSKSPYASPFFFKHEKNKLWPIIDYSRLNAHLIKDKYPLPAFETQWMCLRELQFTLRSMQREASHPCRSGQSTNTAVLS